ncbi:hypothetical protein [Absidia glauca]|uniref:Uncharacterized protein n=1 Tax=Absidia glauca TaxID=4829 RepID=A0A163K5F1_ABSGL|nr:hypothetical protein [Absidia glauca]
MQKANVGLGKRKDGQDGEKERLALYSSSFNVVVAIVVCHRRRHCQWNNKSGEGAKKKRIKGLSGESDTYSLFNSDNPD